MARSVSTGWSIQTPGACPECGSENDYGCDGRGTVRCSCDPEFDESYDTTEAPRQPKAEQHWIVGGGSVGCLYDYGPDACETLDDAIEALAGVYDLTTAEKNELRWNKILAFDPEPGSALEDDSGGLSRRQEAGADYCEITCHDGPCPESEE